MYKCPVSFSVQSPLQFCLLPVRSSRCPLGSAIAPTSLSMYRCRLRIMSGHCLDSVLQLDRLESPLLEAPHMRYNLFAVVDIHTEQTIVSFIEHLKV